MVDGKFKCEWPYFSLYDINFGGGWVYVGVDVSEKMKWKMKWNEKNIQKLFNFFDIILL